MSTNDYGSIAVFKNTKRDKETQPLFNVKIDLPDGTKFEAGLWVKTSKSGLEFLGGQLKPPYEANGRQAPPARPRRGPDVDPDVPFDAPRTPAKVVDW
jgi:hypothetical protein